MGQRGVSRDLGHWLEGSKERVLAEQVSVNSLVGEGRAGRSVHTEEATEQRRGVETVWAASKCTPTQGVGLLVPSDHPPRDRLPHHY